jgi:hypothetical protein
VEAIEQVEVEDDVCLGVDCGRSSAPLEQPGTVGSTPPNGPCGAIKLLCVSIEKDGSVVVVLEKILAIDGSINDVMFCSLLPWAQSS